MTSIRTPTGCICQLNDTPSGRLLPVVVPRTNAYRRSFTAARATPSLSTPCAAQPRRRRAPASRAAPLCRNGVVRRRHLFEGGRAFAGPRAVQHHVPGAALGAPPGGVGGAEARRALFEVFSAVVWPRLQRRAAAPAASRRVFARGAPAPWRRRGVSRRRAPGALTGGVCAPLRSSFALLRSKCAPCGAAAAWAR